MSTTDLNNRLNVLLQKYVDKTISNEEHQELFGYIKDEDVREHVLSFMDEHQKTIVADVEVHETDWDTMYNNITNRHKNNRYNIFSWWNLAIAAMLFVVGGYTIFSLSNETFAPKQEFVYKNDVSPGGNKAILTLSDGSKITLTNHSNGNLATQDGISIEKDADGQIVYHVNNSGDGMTAASADEIRFNTLSTPAGGTFKVVLSDGSKVWLNASSSLKFPVAFAHDQRRVEVSGEAYFEIEKDKSKPFYVINRGSEVKVLGTHFDVMSYYDEQHSSVTLLEGSIQFTKNNKSEILTPGMQILYRENAIGTKQLNANVEEVMAWKNGLFVFNNSNIDEIMKDLSRWYDIEVQYEGDKPDIAFTGVLPRNANVSKVLKILEATGDVKFGIDGQTVVCSRKNKK